MIRFNYEQRLVHRDVEQTLDDSARPLDGHHVDGVRRSAEAEMCDPFVLAVKTTAAVDFPDKFPVRV